MPVPTWLARAAYAAVQVPYSWAHRGLQPGEAFAVAGREAHGFTVASSARVAPIDADYAKLRLALDLVADWDPRRFARMRRDVRYIVVHDLRRRCDAAYVPGSATVYLDAGALRRLGAPVVALLLVHEAAHARLDRAGVGGWPDLRARLERRCGREELSFARRLAPERFPGVTQWLENRARLLADAELAAARRRPTRR